MKSTLWRIAAAVGGVALTGLAGWAVLGGTAAEQPVAEMRDFVDATGRRVRIPQRPQRILCLSTSAGTTIEALGCSSLVVGIDEYSAIAPGLSSLPVVCKAGILAREKVQCLRPDLAFVWWYQDDTAGALAKLGVPVVRMGRPRAMALPALASEVGALLDRADRGNRLAAHLQDSVADLDQTYPNGRVSVYLELYGPYRTVGRDSYISDLIWLAGGRNVVDQPGGGMQISPEALLEADPDVVVLVNGYATAEQFAARPGMARLQAVREGRISGVDRRLLVAGPGITEAVSILGRRISSGHNAAEN